MATAASNGGEAADVAATPIAFDVPPQACDCHVHVFGDRTRFPLWPGRTYTPAEASVEELGRLQRALRLGRVVIVQPSVYGADNSCTLDAIRRLGPIARGVAVIDGTTSRAALDEMATAGVRGIRLNLETAGEFDPSAARAILDSAIRQLEGRDWHIQIYTRPSVIAALADALARVPRPIVIDHFGGAKAALGLHQPGFDALIGLVRSGAYVKISGAYRISDQAPDYADAAALAQALVSANPDRVVWGTDWPHTNSRYGGGATGSQVAPPFRIDDGRLLNQLAKWVPDLAARRKILVDNPARLYDF